MKHQLAISIIALILFLASPAQAAPTKYNMSGKVAGASGYSILLVQKNGTTRATALKPSGSFTFKNLSLKVLKGSSLQLVDAAGRYAGPVVLGKKGTKVSLNFSGKAKTASSFILGRIALKDGGYAALKGKLDSSIYAKAQVPAVGGKPIGAGEYGLVETISANAIRVRSEAAPSAGADGDLDGIPDAFDADDDGDLVLDASDPDSAGLDVPYTSLNFDFRRTLNAHVRDGLSDEKIDEAVGGENAFSLTFFFSLPEESSVDSGHVICADSLAYCRRDTPLAYYGGVSESSDSFRNRPWSELLSADGYPRMEKINLSGGSAIVASIQPRVGRDQFAPGDVYQVALTEGSTTRALRSLALTPYFVSVPAIKEYNSGSGTLQVDYAAVDAQSGSIPGTSEGDPIVLTADGNLTLTFWRPQRQALRSDESGYYDWGNLNYGVIISNAQATCAGYYSAVSSELEEDSQPLGNGDSPLANQGANMNPYRDLSADRAADASNTLTFTVNLKDCLARSGGAPGVHLVTLSAAGEDLTGGRNSAQQNIYVQIP